MNRETLNSPYGEARIHITTNRGMPNGDIPAREVPLDVNALVALYNAQTIQNATLMQTQILTPAPSKETL